MTLTVGPPYIFLYFLILNCSSIVLTKDKNTTYACITEDCYAVTKLVRNQETKKWDIAQELPRSETDNTEVILQLKLDKYGKVLFGKNLLEIAFRFFIPILLISYNK